MLASSLRIDGAAVGYATAWPTVAAAVIVVAIALGSRVVSGPSARRKLRSTSRRSGRRNAAFALYRDLIANSTAGILLIGRRGEVHPCNRVARALFRVNDRLPRRGRHIAELFDPDDRARVAHACSASLGRPVDDRLGVFLTVASLAGTAPSRWRCRAFDGTPFEADVYFERVDGDAWPVAVIVRPTAAPPLVPPAPAAVNLLGRHVAAADADALDVDVVSVVSHELRTPINALLGLAGAMTDREDDGLDPQLRRDLRQIERTANDMRRMVDALLELDQTRIAPVATGRGGVTPAAIAREVAAEFRVLVDEHQCTLEVVADEDDEDERRAATPADAEVIRRVMRNLVGNAIKHASGAAVTIAVRADEADAIVFTVADNGPGIESARIDRLFDARPESLVAHRLGSSGLGLAICRQFLRRVSGRIDVRSTAGIGTMFTVTVPRARQAR